MKLEINGTTVFERNYDAYLSGKRFLINQGGSRSSKSVSIIQMLIYLALEKPNRVISIVRASFPSLKATAIRDLMDMLNQYNLYTESQHNKTDNYYTFKNGSIIEWFSLDDSQKVRGRKRNILFIDEANEIDKEMFIQLNLRCESNSDTKATVFIAYNPSEFKHWAYDLIEDEKAILIKSTYKDNGYLKQDQIDEIEKLINIDYNYYRIYCLGESPTNDSLIYSHFRMIKDFPNVLKKTVLGLDLGYNDPCALVECAIDPDDKQKVYVKELLHKTKLTSSDIVTELLKLDIGKAPIYVDSARPEIIADLKRAGFNAIGCDKRSIKAGINTVKKHQIFYIGDNITNEVTKYRWKTDSDGIVTDIPVDKDNHLMDAIRYALHSSLNNSTTSTYLQYLLKSA